MTNAGATARRVLGPELTELRKDYRTALIAAAATDGTEAVERVVRHPIHERLCEEIDGDGDATQTYVVPHEMLHLVPFQLRATPHGD